MHSSQTGQFNFFFFFFLLWINLFSFIKLLEILFLFNANTQWWYAQWSWKMMVYNTLAIAAPFSLLTKYAVWNLIWFSVKLFLYAMLLHPIGLFGWEGKWFSFFLLFSFKDNKMATRIWFIEKYFYEFLQKKDEIFQREFKNKKI